MANYFDNDKVTAWILLYLDYDPEERKVNEDALHLREKIVVEVVKIVNAIIFTHKFIVWDDYNDLLQEASEACIKALEKFNPNYITSKGVKATAFNYFSLTAKRCLKYYTIRNKKNRENQPIEDHQFHLETPENHTLTDELAMAAIIRKIRSIMDTKKNQKFLDLVDVLEEYVKKMGTFNKRDFFRFAKFKGWSPNLIRRFMSILKDGRDELYEEIDETSY